MTRLLAAIALTLTFAASAAAQGEPVALLTVSNRFIEGAEVFSLVSPVTQAEVNAVPNPVVYLQATMQEADRLNVNTRLMYRIFLSGDQGATWQFVQGSGFSGGEGAVVPFVVKPAQPFVGKLIRIEIDSPVRLRLGGSLSIVDASTLPF
jgi:hypothetical protein